MEFLSFYAKDANGNALFDISEGVRTKFITIYNQKFKQGGEVFYEQQARLFIEEMKSGPYAQALQKCSEPNLIDAFLTIAIDGLSLEKGNGTECYLEARSQKVGNDPSGKPIYGNMARITISGYGEIKMRKRAGQILGITSPTIVWTCDQVEVGEQDGKKFVNYRKSLIRPKDAMMVACFYKIMLPGGLYDYYVMTMEDMARLAEYSTNKGKNKANALYTSNNGQPDTGFFIAKAIKHGFKGYPKIDVGSAVMESDLDSLETPDTEAVAQPTDAERMAEAQRQGGTVVQEVEEIF